MILVGITSVNQWKIYLVIMITSLILAMIMIIYSESKSALKPLLIICVITIIYAEFSLSRITVTNIWNLYLGLELFFIAFNIIEAILPSLINKESPAEYKGTAISIYTTHQFFGITFGGILGGWILLYTTYEIIFITNTIIALIWLITTIIIKNNNKNIKNKNKIIK